MKKSVPDITIACPVCGCPRRVGPYFSTEYAQRAMETHIRMRHNVIRRARSYVDGAEGWDRA